MYQLWIGVGEVRLIFGGEQPVRNTARTCRKFERGQMRQLRIARQSQNGKSKVKGGYRKWQTARIDKQHHVHHAKGLCINCYNQDGRMMRAQPIMDRFVEDRLN